MNNMKLVKIIGILCLGLSRLSQETFASQRDLAAKLERGDQQCKSLETGLSTFFLQCKSSGKMLKDVQAETSRLNSDPRSVRGFLDEQTRLAADCKNYLRQCHLWKRN
jgi:hypothetical protein